MYYFIEHLKMELRLYRRGIWVWLILALLLIYLFTGYYIIVGNTYSVGQLLQLSTYILMAGTLFGLVLGVISAQRERKVKFEEVLISLPGDWVRPFSKIFAWGIIVFILSLFSCAEVIFFYILSKSQLLLFWKETVAYIFLYWGFTMFNAGIVGFAFAYLFRSYFTYIGLFFYWILTSPYNSIILPEIISRWMNQGEQNPNLTYDDYHGLFFADSIFTRHLIIFFLSIALVILALVIRQVRESTKKEKMILIVTSVSTFLLSIILLPLSANSLMKDENASSEDIYYRQFQEQNPLNNTYNVSPTLQIKSYKIDLNTKNEKISYIATLSVNISKENHNKWNLFTLYHGLKVNSVHLDDNEINWKQEGDVVSILWPEKSKGELTFKIEGVTSTFNPVDNKSFYLSASFPWYPIPGKWRIAEIDVGGNIRYIFIELQTPAHFHIKYHNKERIFSNLLKVSENEFKGEAKGVTLMKGNLLESNEKGMHIVAPPDLITRVPILLPKMRESLDEISFNLKESNIKIPKNIFVVPVEEGNNDVELYSDQIVIDADQLRLFYGKEEKYFNTINCLIPSFYLNRSNHLYDSESLFLALYNSLYANSSESYNNKKLKSLIEYPESLRDKKARSIPSQIIALQNKISREKMQVLLQDWYYQLKVGKLSVEYIQTSLNNFK